MSYREERDALRARVDKLEGELGDTREALALGDSKRRPERRTKANLLLGGPTRLSVQRAIEGSLDEEAFETLVVELHDELGEVGRIERVGSLRTWSTQGRSNRIVEVTCREEENGIRIVANESFRQYAGGLFGGVVGGVGGGGLGLVVPAAFGLGLSGPLTMLAAVLWVMLVFVIMRAYYAKLTRTREDQLNRLLDRVQDKLTARLPATERELRIDGAGGEAAAEAEMEAEMEAEGEAAELPSRGRSQGR